MIFHLAIPAYDLEESKEFYKSLGSLAAEIGREYKNCFIMKLFGAQVVCHENKDIAIKLNKPKMYPRHFGVIIDDQDFFYGFMLTWKDSPHVFEPFFKRYEGKPEEHWTFFLKDPSNNVIEFKWYRNPGTIF